MDTRLINELKLQVTNHRIAGWNECETYIWPEMSRDDRKVYLISCPDNDNYTAIVDFSGEEHEVKIERTQLFDRETLQKIKESINNF